MVEQARARNVKALESGRVDLRHGSVVSLPFEDRIFDKALAINSLQVWPDAVAGLREMRRVTKRGGGGGPWVCPSSRKTKSGVAGMLTLGGFIEPQVGGRRQGLFV